MPAKKDYDTARASYSVPELVKMVAAIGGTQEEIAMFTGVPLRTLKRRLTDPSSEISTAYAEGIKERADSLQRMLFAKARSGDTVAMIWLTKNLLGWRDKAEIDITSAMRQLNRMSDDELLRVAEGDEADEAELVEDGPDEPSDEPIQ